MSNIADHYSGQSGKAIVLGESGSGKTGALISLVEAGFDLRILDFDNGLSYLANLIKTRCPDKQKNVIFETCQDNFDSINGKPSMVGQPVAMAKGTNLINHWKTDTEDLGPVSEWGSNDVLVIDSLTFMAEAALRAVMAIKGRSNQKPEWGDWDAAGVFVKNFLSILTAEKIKCNVVVTAILTYIREESTQTLKGYPATVGQKLSPKVPTFFNTMLSIYRTGVGEQEKRVLRTRSYSGIECKTAGPGIPFELPLGTALATYFNFVRKGVTEGETNVK